MSNPTENPPPLSTPSTGAEDRTVAILAYITIIGFIVAIVIHGGKKTALGSFHLRQVLGLIVSGIAFGICAFILAFIPILGWLAIMAGWVCLLVIWLMGLIAAASGQQKPAPILGAQYQKWFSNAFN